MKKTSVLIILLAAIALTGCQANNSSSHPSSEKQAVKGTYQQLKQSEAKANLDADKNIILLDVRTPGEFEETHIPGSLLIPDYDLEKSISEKLPDKDTVIYVYCRSGRRSSGAAKKLIEMGYKEVYDIGGIIDWQYETVSGKE